MLQGHQVTNERYRQFDSSFVYQQARRDPFPHLVTFDSRASPLVRGSEHNRHIPGCLNVIADHLSCLNQPIPTEWSLHPEIVKCIFGLWGTPEVDMFATVSNSHFPWFMSPIPEPRALAVGALSQDWQGRSMYMFLPFPLLNKVIQKLWSTQAAEVILIAPWWPKQSSLCGSPPVLSLPSRSSVPAGSARSMSRAESRTICTHGGSHVNYKAAGFSDEVSRPAAAPRRPSTNRMYDDRWLRFA